MVNIDIEKKYPKTFKAILESFGGESEARNKYDFFAKVAKKEGHHKIAEFFEETARNEMMHAKLLFRLISGISDDTKENLKTCIEGEHYEHSSMYPKFAELAKEEGFKEAEILFTKLAKIELDHEKRFKRLLEELENNTLYSSKTGKPIAWICRVCGNIEYGENPPEICPVCKHPKGHFERLQQEY